MVTGTASEEFKIDIIANDGSPLGVIPSDVYGKGVGGAELALISFAEVMGSRGHEVTVYNDPVVLGEHNGVEFANRKDFNKVGKRDVLIVFRSPNPMLVGAHAKLRKVWWSMDQYTVGNFKVLSTLVDYCVTISPYHTAYHVEKYGINPKIISHLDLGVRLQDYEQEVEKIQNRMIFCSIPDRGLQILHAAWPLILKQVPTATLAITSDYTLWGSGPGNAKHRLDWAAQAESVDFVGNVPRSELIKLQMQAEINPYPCTYEEMFCVSVAECQVAGAFPVTSQAGALKSTNEYGVQISRNLQHPKVLQEDFVDRICELMTKEREYLNWNIESMKAAASVRFNWHSIAEKWEHLFLEGSLEK